ncbi:hypothetical protein CEXT_176261 [Caerostris extrusa]|uniref:Uncharacterized protein n=1 Tax=Caerostris extrusa TaxID=172846 RepID=A0AAV4NSA2_CAEEX|nr:hypothetical protein CEXT_176261 [Caerostris extrusa]
MVASLITKETKSQGKPIFKTTELCHLKKQENDSSGIIDAKSNRLVLKIERLKDRIYIYIYLRTPNSLPKRENSPPEYHRQAGKISIPPDENGKNSVFKIPPWKKIFRKEGLDAVKARRRKKNGILAGIKVRKQNEKIVESKYQKVKSHSVLWAFSLNQSGTTKSGKGAWSASNFSKYIPASNV